MKTSPTSTPKGPTLDVLIHDAKLDTLGPHAGQTQAEMNGLYPADPDFDLRGGFVNPMVDAAMPLIGLAIRLQTVECPDDIGQLYKDVHTSVTTVVDEMRQRGYDPIHLEAYSYSLCLFLDEVVMRTSWGNNSVWSQNSLLSDFHNESGGGEKFFRVLSRMMLEPATYQQLLEFMYICLCMGLKGKYALEPKGDEALQAIIVELHRLIRELRGPTPDWACDTLHNVVSRKHHMPWQWPWWSPLVIAALALTAIYNIYAYRLDLITEEVLQSLDVILRLQ
ncbi:type IVB secretion system protein IcmH/DotU [Pseudomonas fontis]|uniref:Type IVB secretion system protein IcmH/DotU n=1 Tax=Pseudomonas fontis TaxID=2942633 RepID=A0ABT5NR66_9PSED|nr:type IVB secretion system protein IcmH/DotU [Pseudomonas fontis]MDD0977310.1 type IVB secretion system protein IcmH/DotU [Pseudomonas fontis]MDD0990653.1 type IVB secretion system protein IcmH/DotU [Pseudomonas fontis]